MKTPKVPKSIPTGLERVLEMSQKCPPPKLIVGGGRLRIQMPVGPPRKRPTPTP